MKFVSVVTAAKLGSIKVTGTVTVDNTTGAVNKPPHVSPKYSEKVSLLKRVSSVNGKPEKFKSLASPRGPPMAVHVVVTGLVGC